MENKNRNDQGKIAGLIGIITNTLLATGKLVAGLLSASITIIADALNNFTDGISSVVTMIGFKLAKKPADSEHPYGHARFEYVASLIISIIILFVGFELVKSSFEKIFSPEPIVFSIVTIIILAISIIVKFCLYIYYKNVSQKIESDTLKAISFDCRNDAIVTFTVLSSIIFETLTDIQIDSFMGLGVAIFIIISGIKLTLETISPILGKKNNDEIKQLILDKLKEYPIVIAYHDLMIHDYGPGTAFCSIHFEIDKNHDPLYVHELIDKFEREFLAFGISLTVHYDPVITDSPELNSLKHTILSTLVDIDNRLSLHDFRSIPCDGFIKVFFDVPIPDELLGQEKMIVDRVSIALNNLNDKKYQPEITFDSHNFN